MAYYVCLLEGFNNYFNRKIIGYDDLSDYQSAASQYFVYSSAVNYNPRDNVSTELIINDCPFLPDYLIFYDSDSEIVSRWFVLKTVQTRKSQYQLTLRRDVLYDYKDNILNAPVYVQKAYLSDSDPFIVNDEGMSFNQIKQSEMLLKDDTESAWIVGYIAKNAASTNPSIQSISQDFEYYSLSDIATEMDIDEEDLAALLNFDGTNTNPAFFTKQLELRYGTKNQVIGYTKNRIFFDGSITEMISSNSDWAASWNNWTWQFIGSSIVLSSIPYLADNIISNSSAIITQLSTIFSRTYLTEDQYNILYQYRGKIILYNGTYYTLDFSVENSALTEVFGEYAYNAYSSIETAIDATTTELESLITDVSFSFNSSAAYSLRPTSIKAFIQLQTITDSSSIPSVSTIISSSRKQVADQAFDMFCIPYGSVKFKSDIGTQKSVADYALSIAAQIAVELDANLYDLQLLPYCPLIDLYGSVYGFNLTNLTEGQDFNYIDQTNASQTVSVNNVRAIPNLAFTQVSATATIPYSSSDITAYTGTAITTGVSSESVSITDNGDGTSTITYTGVLSSSDYANSIYVNFTYTYSGTVHRSFILWASAASFTTQLSYTLSLTDSMKVESQCSMYRLVSPNYQGSFEFNLAKNGGSVAYFVAECTYKPYTPYMKIAPQFSFLYGTNFGDCRGLICGGDFSLPRFTDAWETYELNNKNYQNIFNRDIQNMNFEQSIQMRNALVSGGVGIARDTASGAGAGAFIGGGWGAVAGAAIGAAGSSLGFGIDIDTLQRQQREVKSMAIDKYNYQLGNIKALPYTLTKVGAFDINSKIWPFVEFYTCTDEEKEALENKITYESMTVMRIDYLGTYFGVYDDLHYFKGELIRADDIATDSNIVEAIYAELLKGVYI